MVDTTSVENIIGTAYDDRICGDAGANQLTGGDGKDLLNGMGGGDTFIYRAISESTGANYDVITGFNAAADKFDLPFSVTGIDATIGSGSPSSASFDSDLAAAVECLNLYQWYSIDGRNKWRPARRLLSHSVLKKIKWL